MAPLAWRASAPALAGRGAVAGGTACVAARSRGTAVAAAAPRRAAPRAPPATRRAPPPPTRTAHRGACQLARAIREPPPSADDEAPVGYKPSEVTFSDIVSLWMTNIMQTYGNAPSADGAPVAEGVLDDLVGRPLFLALFDYFKQKGGIYKLAFGPKTFMIVSDPVIVKHILRTANLSFDKGVLAEILAPIMGKGLIPADFATWQTRRRALVPGFHSAWLSHMVGLFGYCTQPLLSKLDKLSGTGEVINMEDAFCSLSLDIIGLSVFNYDFGSVNKQSPVIKAVYNVLREAEHRSTFYVPYWNIPFNELVVPRQRAFAADMRVINDTLAELIARAQATQSVTDLAELEARDYANVKDPSLLRFLVDMRGESTTNAQLRDDLMTMLIAGHETTAAVLTWALFELAQAPEYLATVRAEIDAVCPDGAAPDYAQLRRLTRVRLCVAESLRLYPEPPILIRRALDAVELPRGGAAAAVTLPKGADVFISLYNLHRSPALWDSPDAWNPDRFLTAAPPDGSGWEGRAAYDTELGPQSPLYPNEVASDFSFLPFGGGARKCIGDQFAVLEATVVLAQVLQRFDFAFETGPQEVGMVTGATIHTANGLRMRVTKRAGWAPAKR